jgi:lipopolysaccharide transport system ATP-binding protein
MSSNDLAIKVTDLNKCYNIYDKPIDRLKQSIVPKVLNILKQPSRAYFHEFWALKDINLDVRKGETVGIIGRNGSGKSTLLQLICGTLSPTSGRIEAHGRITALLELGSGFNPEFTGRENVFLNGAILGLDQDEIEARFDAIAKFADIGEFIEQPVKFYSSGMTVRLAFAVQAMVAPDILIVDEALAVGDERFQRKCFRRLEELKKGGTSILFVSHSGEQIKELCDKALLLEKGQRIILSDPMTVVRAYQQILYANPDESAHLMQNYKELDRSDHTDIKIATAEVHEGHEYSSKDQRENIYEVDFYENDLVPTSTTIYPVHGAQIQSIKIYNNEGIEVNNLLVGREYLFEIQGSFLEEREAVYIAFGIRTITGSVVSHQIYPGARKYIHNVQRGQSFKLTQKIKMVLTPNTYFAGAGIWSTTEPTIMFKIIDAIMFRVLPQAESRVSGYVDLTIEKPEFGIFEEGKN